MSNDLTEEEKQKRYGDKCSNCGTPWTKTPKNIGGAWWHCLHCKKKAEDIPPKFAKKNEDLLKEFEDMLEDQDWDDQNWKVF